MNLIGKKFNRWTIVGQADDKINNKGERIKYWLCRCDCGKLKVVKEYNLKHGLSKSCGCLRDELTRMANKKYNKYDLSNEFCIGYTYKNEPFYFDLEDYDKIKKYSWYKNDNGYIETRDCETKKIITMHRLVMNTPDDMCVDHIHGSTTKNDNRKSNLRICTNQENRMNVGIRKNNTSGVTGVMFDKNRNKWRAYITIDGKQKYLGRYKTFEEAQSARLKAEKELFGEFSYANSQNIAI